MSGCPATYKNAVPYIFIAAMIFICPGAYPQVTGISKVTVNNLLERLNPGISHIPFSPVPVSFNSQPTFLDSLRMKASKRRITRELYDIVVVDIEDSLKQSTSTGNSEAAYRSFTGKKIRNIEVRRLNVFGANIDDPAVYSESRVRNFLNRTHISTNEGILRKYLLFATGDTLSPLVMSDNERILRDLPFIDDARIIIHPVSDEEVEVLVITKDVYSAGFEYKPDGLKKGSVSIFEKNLFGMGHELGISVPYDNALNHSPGLGLKYSVDNIGKSFVNMDAYYAGGLEKETYGFNLTRKLVSLNTKYAGGVSLKHMYETVDLDTMRTPEPLRYNLQDYWVLRSFLLNREKVIRLMVGARYRNNNVYDRPYILPDSYYAFQKYHIFLGSLAISAQRYLKANLIYGYGVTEDIPYGVLLKVTLGRELNEFKKRNYAGSEVSFSKAFTGLGYLYSSAGLASYINQGHTEQGIFSARLKYFSNLLPVGRSNVRNFIRFDYTRGFDRNLDEHLYYFDDNGFSGFRNDSVQGAQRFTINLETVVFSPVNVYGFRFAFFGFADFASLSGTNQVISHGTSLSGIGLGIRVRNNNLVFNTFQIRIGIFPDPPRYSRINYITVSGEQQSEFENFDSGPPSMIPYR